MVLRGHRSHAGALGTESWTSPKGGGHAVEAKQPSVTPRIDLPLSVARKRFALPR
jgi:hypothetical protein